MDIAALEKRFSAGGRTIRAVAGVDMVVRRGDFVAIMGSSGSGKSTFMSLLGLLDVPDGGSLMLDGSDVTGLDHDRLATIRNRSFGFVFQHFNLLPRTSALDNVALPLVYAGVPLAERRRRAAEVLASLGLGDRTDHTPNRLSGGQQQRVAIARALINRPSLLLADEPTGALDSATTVEIMELFSRLNAEGLTIVLVTHEREVAAYARRTVLFDDGRIVLDGVVE